MYTNSIFLLLVFTHGIPNIFIASIMYNDFSVILICFIHFNYFISTLGRMEEQIPVCFYHIVYLNCVLYPE